MSLSESSASEAVSSDDDEPLVKQKVPKGPTDDELVEAIKKTLDGIDLEEVSMKQAISKVYAKFPGVDLSDRKNFIKEKIRYNING